VAKGKRHGEFLQQALPAGGSDQPDRCVISPKSGIPVKTREHRDGNML
jgi:hypothetical protein